MDDTFDPSADPTMPLPHEKETEDEVLAFVRAEPGAIGYVSADKKLGDGVKELKVIP